MDSQPSENESTQPPPNIVDLFPFYSNYLWNRLTSLIPTSNSIFLGKISNLYRQTVSRKRHISFPLPLPSDFPTSSTITSNTSADTARIYGVLEEIMADVLSNLHDIQKSLDFWQSRVEGSNASKAYFMIFERGPVAFVNESMKFVSKSLSEDSAMQHLCQSSSSHMMERIRVLVELRSALASFLAQLYVELNKRGEDLVKNPETSLASLLAVINGLFSNLEESFSHLHAERECDSSVNGGYPVPLVFDRLPEVNEEGSQWTDCELTDAINLVHKNLEKLNSYLSVMVGKHRKPRRMTLHWVRYTFGAVGLSVFSLWLLRHSSLMGSSDIENWVRDAKEATVSFFSDHVEQPLLSIRDELFDTFRKRHKGVMESEEVQLTHDSLHRILKNFCEQATREKVPDNASDQEMLTVVMHRYEKELVHPIHNLLSGELARGLLIQVQKLKLDIETAMLKLDQILRANEINFAILAALPAFFLSIVMLTVLRTWLKKDSRAQGRGRIARIHRRLLVGKDAIEAGDRSRALKFLDKARRFDPSLPIDGLVSHLMKQSDESVVSSAAKESSKPWLCQRGSSSSSSSFTEEEQRAIVKEIKTKKDYYEILGLENNCSVEDIRKAYRKLSLKVHPDKNKAAGSEEAFISVSKAFQCLSNEDTRRIYDITGGSSDEPVYQPRRAPTRYNNYEFNGFYDYEFDAPRRYNYVFSDDILAFIDFLFLLYRVWRGFVSFLRRIKR